MSIILLLNTYPTQPYTYKMKSSKWCTLQDAQTDTERESICCIITRTAGHRMQDLGKQSVMSLARLLLGIFSLNWVSQIRWGMLLLLLNVSHSCALTEKSPLVFPNGAQTVVQSERVYAVPSHELQSIGFKNNYSNAATAQHPSTHSYEAHMNYYHYSCSIMECFL